MINVALEITVCEAGLVCVGGDVDNGHRRRLDQRDTQCLHALLSSVSRGEVVTRTRVVPWDACAMTSYIYIERAILY